jgi:hypothetical protein
LLSDPSTGEDVSVQNILQPDMFFMFVFFIHCHSNYVLVSGKPLLISPTAVSQLRCFGLRE